MAEYLMMFSMEFTMGLLGQVIRREPFLSEGKSGSQLERAWLDDGLVVVIKYADASQDWIMQATGDDGRIATMWASGVFDRMPKSIEHAMLEAHRIPGGAVVVMKDVSGRLFADGMQFRSGHARVLRAAADLHRAFRERPAIPLCPLSAWYSFLSPAVCAHFARDHEVPRMALEGWSRFHEIVSKDVAGAIASIHADPAPLAAALSRRESKLVHGDLKMANLGSDSAGVVMVDWGTLTMWAPPAVDYAWYMAINAAAIGDDHDRLLDDVRLAAGSAHDETAMQLALIGALAQLGWEKALGATDNDAAIRQRERDGLAWWMAQAHRTLELWSP